MKTALLAAVIALQSSAAFAINLRGNHELTITGYQPNTAYVGCLRLVSDGNATSFSDHGTARMLIGKERKFFYLGQYTLTSHELSVVVGNYGDTAQEWFFFTSQMKGKQWATAFYGHFHAAGPGYVYTDNGTLTEARPQTVCH